MEEAVEYRRARFAANAGDKSTVVWLTPPQIIEVLGPFDMDPCAASRRPWPTADIHYTIEDDGLSKEWKGLVWCNPPYGKQMGAWLDRCAEHGNALALVYGRTDTAVFHRSVFPKATAILFLEGRINFHDEDGSRASTNGGAPSVIIAYGKPAMLRLEWALRDRWKRVSGHLVTL